MAVCVAALYVLPGRWERAFSCKLIHRVINAVIKDLCTRLFTELPTAALDLVRHTSYLTNCSERNALVQAEQGDFFC